MRWEYFGTGLALIGIGITLMVALPPQWWPKMPPALVHTGVILGGVLTFAGVIIAIFGAWPVVPSPKMAIIGMGLSGLAFLLFVGWFWISPRTSASDTNSGVQIIVATGGSFELVEPAGVNRRRTIRVKIENNTDAGITNGKLQVLNLDPPYRDHTEFLLKSDISIPAHGHILADIAYYDEGSSQGLPGKWMYLVVPPGAFFAEAIPTLPIETPHTFHLKFSTLEGGLFDEVYCRLFVDSGHVLHLENRGDSKRRAALNAEPQLLEPDLDATIAFYEILANSEWSSRQRPEAERSISNWLAQRLDREIHNQLRQERLTAWGHRCLTPIKEAPESAIPAPTWDEIEIDFGLPNTHLSRTSAIWRVRRGGFDTVYAGVRFCRDQIYKRFPLIPISATPTPAGIAPDWPIQQLFYHLKPDLLENADEAAWEKVGNDLRDAFGLNLVRVWGRPLGDGLGKLLGERPILRLIDPSYWNSGHFTYAFFDDTSGDAAHTYIEPNSSLPEYTDLRVNRAEALNAWRR